MKRKLRNIVSCFHDKARGTASIYCFMCDSSRGHPLSLPGSVSWEKAGPGAHGQQQEQSLTEKGSPENGNTRRPAQEGNGGGPTALHRSGDWVFALEHTAFYTQPWWSKVSCLPLPTTFCTVDLDASLQALLSRPWKAPYPLAAKATFATAAFQLPSEVTHGMACN